MTITHQKRITAVSHPKFNSLMTSSADISPLSNKLFLIKWNSSAILIKSFSVTEATNKQFELRKVNSFYISKISNKNIEVHTKRMTNEK